MKYIRTQITLMLKHLQIYTHNSLNILLLSEKYSYMTLPFQYSVVQKKTNTAVLNDLKQLNKGH
jgi:hypothetical protein